MQAHRAENHTACHIPQIANSVFAGPEARAQHGASQPAPAAPA